MLLRPASETQITHLGRLWLYILAALVMAFLILPVFIVIPMSFSDSRFLRFPPEGFSLRWYESYLRSPEWMRATWVSFKVALMTTALATPLGIAAAYGLHVSRVRFARLFTLALISPLVIPIIILGVGIFYLYVQLNMVNTITGLVLAHTILAMPFVVVTVSSGLQQYDLNQERAARSMGASRFTAFRTVTLPQIRGSIVAGALFAFITSLDEVVIALFISGGENTTLTRRMFTGLRDEIDPTIAAISSLLILLSLALLLILTFTSRNTR
ncbi:ABC transporter permease [Plastorhodobacter daqingensis]|uniref:ABC transporter permease n=1 Tax=Plastorhodobacter daqingensis TaxID=1387281 RepID=A0ABW2URC9_9RHOB